MGVLSGIPEADGIVGDLGGGSLELVRVGGGRGVTDPRVLSARRAAARGAPRRARHARPARRQDDRRCRVEGAGEGTAFYLVGGSWRALARLDMHLTDYPLPVVHQYPISAAEVARLGRTLSHISKSKLRRDPQFVRRAAFDAGATANALLASVLKHLGSGETIVSAFGLREGLLFSRLSTAQRREDPLIAAARDEGERLGRFPEHGDLLEAWIAPLFAGEPPEAARAAPCRLPAGRRRLGRQPRVPRRARARGGAARQLGGDRCGRAGAARPGALHRARRGGWSRPRR